MAEQGKKSVDEAIDEVVGEAEGGLAGVKDALGKAQHAMEGARSTMQDAYGKAKAKSHEAAERTRVYLEDARRYLGEAKDRMSTVAAKGREQAEALYEKSREQYEVLSARAKEYYERARDRVAEVDFKQKGDQVLEYIRQNPGKSVLIALAVGFLVGYATRPRD
jgi:ElaB/YqjD/DUF883 family membrane-anchored ribosome-binding protein